jgi:hypothetical protein
MANPPTDAKRLAHYQAELQRLAAEVADVGFISAGSLGQRYTTCGRPDCRCAAHPPELHGPYWHWSKAVAGKTINRTVTEEEVPLYQQWIANRRRLRQIIAEIEKVSNHAIEILLKQVSTTSPQTARPNGKR